MRRIHVLLILLVLTVTAGVIDFTREPRLVVVTKSLSGNTGTKQQIAAATLIPHEKNDWVWWTSSDPSVVAVWPAGLKVGQFSDEKDPALFATAELTFISEGRAQICAELHRRPTPDEIRQIITPGVALAALKDTALMTRVEKTFATLKRGSTLSSNCMEISTIGKSIPPGGVRKDSVSKKIASLRN